MWLHAGVLSEAYGVADMKLGFESALMSILRRDIDDRHLGIWNEAMKLTCAEWWWTGDYLHGVGAAHSCLSVLVDDNVDPVDENEGAILLARLLQHGQFDAVKRVGLSQHRYRLVICGAHLSITSSNERSLINSLPLLRF